jgi:hypothetical protein
MVYLINAVISEALLGRELAVLLSLVAAHHTHRRASPPVITLRSLLEQSKTQIIKCKDDVPPLSPPSVLWIRNDLFRIRIRVLKQ